MNPSHRHQMMIDFRTAGVRAMLEKFKWAECAGNHAEVVANMRAVADVTERCCNALDESFEPPGGTPPALEGAS